MADTRTIDWRTLVIKADGEDYEKERQHPIVYYWSSDRRHRDSGDGSGIYE